MTTPPPKNMPNPINNANSNRNCRNCRKSYKISNPVKQPVLTGPERPENPERLVKPSEVKRAKNQSSLFKRHRRPLSMIQKQAARAAGGSRKYRTKKVRKTRK